jgi:hypothetical protein
VEERALQALLASLEKEANEECVPSQNGVLLRLGLARPVS